MTSAALATPSLDPQLESYCQHYVITRHARRAMAAAGIDPSIHPQSIWVRHDVQHRIAQLTNHAMGAAGISAERVMLELSRCAFSDIREVFDPVTNDLKPVHELDDDTAATLASIEIETTMQLDADGVRRPVSVRKIKRVDKMAALGLLAKHFKIVGDEGDGISALASALADRLKTGRQRAFGQHQPPQADPTEIEDATIIEPAPPAPSQPTSQETDDEQLW
jgi:phage terminase small subunit